MCTHPNLIRPFSLGQIPHPLDTLVITLLKHFQEPHNQPRCREHQHLEIYFNRWSRPHLSCGRACQVCRPRKCAFLTALNSRYPGSRPHYLISLGSTTSYQKTYFHTTTFSAGEYLAFPWATLQSTVVVLSGVGIRSTTAVAYSLESKFVLTVIVYCICEEPISLTLVITRSGNLTLLVDRYLHVKYHKITSIIALKAWTLRTA